MRDDEHKHNQPITINIIDYMFILLANQRSGTNLFRGILNSSPKIAAVPEIFHDTYFSFKKLPDFIHFDYFLKKQLEINPSLGLPANREKVTDDYLSWIDNHTKKKATDCNLRYKIQLFASR